MELAEPEAISRYMAGLNRRYACYHHRTYHTAGFLWQGRFKLQPVQKERYLIACGRYIERNPVRAKLTLKAEDYPYSSAQYYCYGSKDSLTIESPCYGDFGTDIIQRQASYKEFLRDFNVEQDRLFDNMETPLGSMEFIRRLIREGGRCFPKRRGRPKKERIVS
jgi:putative transposase